MIEHCQKREEGLHQLAIECDSFTNCSLSSVKRHTTCQHLPVWLTGTSISPLLVDEIPGGPDDLTIHQHQLPQACPNSHALLSFRGAVLRQAIVKLLEYVMFNPIESAPGNVAELCLCRDRQRHDPVLRVAAPKGPRLQNLEETGHAMNLGHKTVLFCLSAPTVTVGRRRLQSRTLGRPWP